MHLSIQIYRHKPFGRHDSLVVGYWSDTGIINRFGEVPWYRSVFLADCIDESGKDEGLLGQGFRSQPRLGSRGPIVHSNFEVKTSQARELSRGCRELQV